ncbi:MAG: hypothetical protein ACOYWZ_15715 [Bacillota bacterium]
MHTTLNIRTLLEIILSVTKKNANILAESYLLKDKSIISKWKNNSVIPRNDDLVRVVKFVQNETTVAQRRIIRDRIEELIKSAPIKNELKNIIINTEDFGEFLKEVFTVSISKEGNDPASQDSAIDETPDSNLFTGPSENKSGRYKGTLEFDLVIPEGGSVKSLNFFDKPSIEFKGKVNLNPEKKLIKAAKYLRSTSVLGVVLICIVSGTLMAYSTGTNRKDVKVYNTRQIETPSEAAVPVISVTSSPVPTVIPSPAPSPVPVPTKAVEESKPVNDAKVNGTQNQTINKSTTKISNKTTNNNVNISGNNNIYFQGDDNAISIEIN